MLTHLVLMKPRTDLTPSERRAFADAFVTAARDIPGVKGVRVGRRVLHGAGYERTTPDSADFMAIIDFDDLRGLHAYLQHPAHAALGEAFHRSLSTAAVYDFDSGGIELLETFVEGRASGSSSA